MRIRDDPYGGLRSDCTLGSLRISRLSYEPLTY
jgi:hypothetical protein